MSYSLSLFLSKSVPRTPSYIISIRTSTHTYIVPQEKVFASFLDLTAMTKKVDKIKKLAVDITAHCFKREDIEGRYDILERSLSNWVLVNQSVLHSPLG